MQSSVFKIKIGSGPLVTCESLGIGLRQINFNNMQPDIATLVQTRLADEWLGNIDHGVGARLYEYDGTTNHQIFCGLVNSPGDVLGESGRQRSIEVAGLMQLANELTFCMDTAAMWTPRVGLFYAYKTLEEQVTELLDFLVARASAEPMAWQPVLGTIDVSAYFQPPYEIVMNEHLLDMLIRIMKPVPDAFMRVEYHLPSGKPTIRVGMFRNESPAPMSFAYPVMSYNCRRYQHEEATGVIVQQIFPVVPPDEEDDEYYPGYEAYLNPAGIDAIDRRVVSLPVVTDFVYILEAGGDVLYDSLTAVQVKGSITFAGTVRRWIRPGTVLEFDSLPHHVQQVVWDCSTNTITATIGPPRHLGFDDFADIIKAVAEGVTLTTE